MKKKIFIVLITIAVMTSICSLTAFADGDVAGAVESTWTSAKSQIKSIVDNVVFPVIDVIQSSQQVISIIASTVSLSGLLRQFYSAVCCFH